MPFRTNYFVIKNKGDTSFCLVEPLVYEGNFDVITVPAGTTTDFASVPQIFTWLLPRYGVYTRAAIVHDYLCSSQTVISRNDADGIFRRILRELGVSFPVRWMMWTAVRFDARMSGATKLEWFQFVLIAILSIAFLLVPTIILFIWTMVFKLIDRISNV